MKTTAASASRGSAARSYGQAAGTKGSTSWAGSVRRMKPSRSSMRRTGTHTRGARPPSGSAGAPSDPGAFLSRTRLSRWAARPASAKGSQPTVAAEAAGSR